MINIMGIFDAVDLAAPRDELVESVRIIAIKHPFTKDRDLVCLPAGGSIADMIRTLGLDPAIPARIFLDNHIVTQDKRERTYPKAGQILVIRTIPSSGGSSKDQEFLLVAIAAIAAVATYGASLAASAAFTAETGITVGTSAASAASTSISSYIAGAAAAGLSAAFSQGVQILLKAALIPPPRTPVPKQETTPHSYTVSGTANAAAAFSPIPKIYGARRIFPQYAASPYNELVGFDQYLRMLFLLGYGPLDISQIKLGDTALEDYEDVEWELRSGFPDDAPTRLYPGSVSEAELNIQLSTTNGGGIAPTVYDWSQVPVQTSGTNADELGVDVSFPGGLSAFGKASGKPVFIGCRLQIRWAPTGAQNWTYEPVFVIKSTYIGTTGASQSLDRNQDYQVKLSVLMYPSKGIAIHSDGIEANSESRSTDGAPKRSLFRILMHSVFLLSNPRTARRQIVGSRPYTLRRKRNMYIPTTEALSQRETGTSFVSLTHTFPSYQLMSPFFLRNRSAARECRDCHRHDKKSEAPHRV